MNAVIQKTLPKNEITKNFITISKKSKIKIDKILLLLIKLGYERTSLVRDKSEFAIRGSIIDIFLPQFVKPIRIDLFDDEIESIFEFDPITKKDKRSDLESITLNPSNELIIDNKNLEDLGSIRSTFQNFRKSQTYECSSVSFLLEVSNFFLYLGFI